MAKLLISTQVYENYGDANRPYWKPKGGNDYVVKNIGRIDLEKIATPGIYKPEDMIAFLVDSFKPEIETNNEYFHEYVISWDVVEDDYLTEFERSQLQYEGKITYSPRELAI